MKKSILKTVSVLLAALLVFSIIFTGCSDGSGGFNSSAEKKGTYSDMNYISLDAGFTDVKVTDENSALAAAQSVADTLGIKDAKKELKVSLNSSVSGETIYRMEQYCDNVPIYGKSVSLAVDEDGRVLSLNANTVPIQKEKIANSFSDKYDTIKNAIEKNIKNEFGRDIQINLLEGPSKDNLYLYLFNDAPRYVYVLSFAGNSGAYTLFCDASNGKILFYNNAIDSAQQAFILDGQVSKQKFIAENNKNKCSMEYHVDNSTITVSKEKTGHSKDWYLNGNADIVTWKNGNAADKSAVDAMTTISAIQKYYKKNFNWDAFNKVGQDLKIYVHITNADGDEFINNAFYWTPLGNPVIAFCRNYNNDKTPREEYSKDYDIAGHEFTHGIIDHTCNLENTPSNKMPDAINEGIADIMGLLIEEQALSKTIDWEMTYIARTPIKERNTKKGQLYHTDEFENSSQEEHISSTIISYPAYLMWNGIDGKENYKIKSEYLAEIWFKAILMLNSDATFNQVGNAVYKAASTMKELSSDQMNCIKEAFKKVGINISAGNGYRIREQSDLTVFDTNLIEYDNYHLKIEQVINSRFESVNKTIIDSDIKESSYALDLEPGQYHFYFSDNDAQGSDKTIKKTVAVLPSYFIDNIKVYTDFGVAKISDFTIPDDKICTIGQIDIIEPETVPADAEGYSLQWTSSNESVATVTPNGSSGTINPIAKGETDITATLVSGGKTIEKTTHLRVASKGRDTVLVLDVSGSMSGAPMEEMKKAAIQFCDDLIAGEYNNRVGLVLYDSQVDSVDLTNDLDMLKGYINGLSAGSTTNMEGGLSRAIGMLNDQGAENSIKNIVIMADGLPNEGATSYSGSMPTDSSYTLFSADLAYANAVIDAAKDAASRSYNVYSLGFFHTINPGAEYNFASTLMKNITNMDDGYHEVERVEDLQFQFADVQKDISNGAKTIINIACPVDVSVSYNGETLSSNADSFNDTASFGSLQLLGKNKDVKVLSLEPGIDYDIQMNGTGQGTMDYTVNYIDDDENIEDYRSFESVPITPTTKIDSNTNNSDVVKLNVDENGDGKVDQVWSANKNSTTKQEDQKKESKKPVQKKESLPTWVIVLIIVGAVLLILILVLCIVLAKNKKKAAQARPLPQKRPNPNPQPVRPPVAPVMPSYQKQGAIVFTSGEYKGARITLKEGDEVIMGKDSKISSIVFSEASISRKHCSIRMVGGEFILNDYSTNGVYSSLTKTKLKLAGASYTLHYHEAITLSKTNNTFYCE